MEIEEKLKMEWIVPLFCAVVLLLLPVLVFHYFPNQDGPAHVNSTLALEKLNQQGAFLAHYFTQAPLVPTNWVTTFILSSLQHVVPTSQLESSFVILYVLLMTGGIIVAVYSFLRISLGYVLAFFPLVFSHMLHMGSFNYVLACALFLPLLGLCHRYLIRPSLSRAVMIALVLFLVFLLHVEIAMLALICVGIYGLWISAFTLFGESQIFQSLALRNTNPSPLRFADAFLLALACLPAVTMCLIFYMQNEAIESRPHYAGLAAKFFHLFFLTGIASYSVFGMGVSVLILLAVIGGIWLAIRNMVGPFRLVPADAMLICAVILFSIFMAMPNGIGDAFNIEERLMIPMLLALIGWIVLRITPRYVGAVAIIAIGIILLQNVDRALAFDRIGSQLDEYTEVVNRIPDNNAVIVVNLDQVADRSLDRDIQHPFALVTRFDSGRNFMGTALGDRNVAFLSNYEALATRPYFPLKYQNWLSKIVGDSAFDLIAAGEAKNKAFSKALAKLKKGPAPVTYLAVWTLDPASADNPNAKAFLKTVGRNYALVFVSTQSHMFLYRMR